MPPKRTPARVIEIAWLFPRHLSTYGDVGNIRVIIPDPKLSGQS